MSKEIEHTAILDKATKDVIKGNDSDKPLRISIWNHLFEKNEQSTDKTVVEMKPVLDMTDDEVIKYATDLLK